MEFIFIKRMIKTKCPAIRHLTASLVWYPVAILAPSWVSIGSCSIRCRLRIKKNGEDAPQAAPVTVTGFGRPCCLWFLMISLWNSERWIMVNLFGSELKIFWVVSTPTPENRLGQWLRNNWCSESANELAKSSQIHKQRKSVSTSISSGTPLRSGASLAAKVRSCRRHFGLDDFGWTTAPLEANDNLTSQDI